MIARQDEQGFTCPGCGGNLLKTTAKANQGLWTAKHLVCHRCAPIERLRAKLAKNKGPSDGFLIFSSER